MKIARHRGMKKAIDRRFSGWLRELGERKDTFLGYCSKSAGVAAQMFYRNLHNF